MNLVVGKYNYLLNPKYDNNNENGIQRVNILIMLASVGVTPRIFPTFTITQKQEELESSVLQ